MILIERLERLFIFQKELNIEFGIPEMRIVSLLRSKPAPTLERMIL
jgi:hypothetical protein